jgi:predicted ATPase/DNA-binding winged helix-turn-helix (wHTH) protein
LLDDGKPVPLGSRAFELLVALLEHAGEIVSRETLMARAWPGISVGETNLRVHIAALRKALREGSSGQRFISNVPGRGYCFVASVERREVPPRPGDSPPEPVRAQKLPTALTRVIGRAEIVGRTLEQLPQRRLVTIVGPGGIGKTTVAVAVAEVLAGSCQDGVRFIDLGLVSDPHLLPGALVAALGIALHGEDLISALVGWLRDKQMLIVLDCCEHLVETAAALVEALLRDAPGVLLLATSREPLRAEGEWVHRLPPLGLPPASATLTAAEALRAPAVQLFVERASASLGGFELADADAPIVADICRRLDGIALAIELAAGRVGAFGLAELARLLDDRFAVLTRGRRTALLRHQTLRAVLDWSYGLLAEPERVVLRRLAVFAGHFALEAAAAVAAGPQITRSDVVRVLSNLVAKSLVLTESNGGTERYRLLDTTRAYGTEKLAQSGELDAVARRHAEFYRDLFERAETEWETRPTVEWLADYGWRLGNLRAALDWAFSPGGDALIGVALTAGAVPLWMYLSLLDECRGRVQQALSSLDAGISLDACREMKLHGALGGSLNYTRRETAPETGAAWTKALEIAERLDDAEYQLRSFRGLWAFHTVNGRYRVALALAQRFHALAANRADPGDRLVGERLIGISRHYLGDQPGARHHLERAVNDYAAVEHRSYTIRFPIDPRMAERVVLARVLWLQGFPNQAMRATECSIEGARAADHVASLCYALAMGACLIALLVGDLDAAEHYVGMLLDHSTKHALTHWRALGTCHQGALAIKRGDVVAGSRLLLAGFSELGDSRLASQFVALLMTEALGHAGQASERVAELNEAIERSEQVEECWLTAELLRLKGERLVLRGTQGAATEAEGHFRQALDCARRQGALSLELRAATSLARLLRNQGRSADAVALLRPVYDRFTEGFDTADLKAAEELLNELRS